MKIEKLDENPPGQLHPQKQKEDETSTCTVVEVCLLNYSGISTKFTNLANANYSFEYFRPNVNRKG